MRVNVTGRQETVAVGRPQFTNSAFTQALTESITKSRTFSGVVEEQSRTADYLLTGILSSWINGGSGGQSKSKLVGRCDAAMMELYGKSRS